MEQGSIAKLKFDSRLSRRRGWLTKEENEANLQALPDASEKISTPEDEAPEPVAEATEQAAESSLGAVPAFEVQTDFEPAANEAPVASSEPEGELLSDPLSPPPFKEL